MSEAIYLLYVLPQIFMALGINWILLQLSSSSEKDSSKPIQKPNGKRNSYCSIEGCNTLIFRNTDFCWKHQSEEKEVKSQKDTGWWNDGIELNASNESLTLSKPKDKTEISVKQTLDEENSIFSFVKGFVVLIIFFIFAQILDSLGLPIWELLAIIFFLLEILGIFF